MRWRTTVTDDPDDKTQGRFGLMSRAATWFRRGTGPPGLTLVSSGEVARQADRAMT